METIYQKQLRKDKYYLSIAETVARKSTCLRRKYGAIIVNNDEIISTGYNGSPRGCLNCTETGCMREIIGIGKGDAYNLCVSVHAEQNAIISARRTDMIGATMYIVGLTVQHTDYEKGYVMYADPSPCLLCHRMIINSGITRVVGIKSKMCTVPTDKEIEVIDLDVSNLSFMMKMQQEYTKTVDKLDNEIHEKARLRISAAGPEVQDFTKDEKDEMNAYANARRMIRERQELVEALQAETIYKRYGMTDAEIALLKSGRPVREVKAETLEKYHAYLKDAFGANHETETAGVLPVHHGDTGPTTAADHPIFTTPNDMVHEMIHKDAENVTGTVSVMGVKRPQDPDTQFQDIENPRPKR